MPVTKPRRDLADSPMPTRSTREAFFLLKAGRVQEARDVLESIVHSDNADAAVLETLGDVREKLGDTQGALDAYSGAVTHLRVRGEFMRALAVLELMGLVDETLAAVPCEAASVRRALDDDEGCWQEVLRAVELLLRHGDISAILPLCMEHADVLKGAAPALEAIRCVDKVERASAVELCCSLAQHFVTHRRFDDALALYACALDMDPAGRAALHGRAAVLLLTHRAAEARVVAERALALDPNDMVGLCLLERAALALGDGPTAAAARRSLDGAARAERTLFGGPVDTPGGDDSEDTGRHTKAPTAAAAQADDTGGPSGKTYESE